MKQITFNIHRGHGIKDLHTIRQEVKPIKSDWKEILGEEFEDLNNLNFWKK